MKKICIVPFTKNEYSLIEFLPPEYVITSLITPMGIGIEGQDMISYNRCRLLPGLHLL